MTADFDVLPAQVGSDTPFAIVDIETTGFSPRLHHRVLEIAIVHLDDQGTETDRWTTLVNPLRDVGATHIHGVEARDLVDAPTFGDIAGDVADRLRGRVIVAHNARFDMEFLIAEFQRTSGRSVDWPNLCTLNMSRHYGRSGGGRLALCLAAEDLEITDQHSALADALATAQLFLVYLRRAATSGSVALAELGCRPSCFPELGWSDAPPLGRVALRRARAAAPPLFEIPLLTQLVRHLPALGHDALPGTGAIDAYVDLLSRALEDRRIAPDEAFALVQTALTWGLSGHDLRQAHQCYLEALAATALADGVVTAIEEADLASVATALGLGSHDVTSALKAAELRERSPSISAITGRTVCFTGSLRRVVDGRLISRERAELIARAAGLVVQPRVTKQLDILVAADPYSLSGKARKAREYGTTLLAEDDFWRMLDGESAGG